MNCLPGAAGVTMAETITDTDRYPTLSEAGRDMLRFLREHPGAPIYRNRSGNRLTAADIQHVKAFEREVEQAEVGWQPGEQPSWLHDCVSNCFAEVPHYRAYGSPPANFADIPTIDRSDLGRDIARFVPDSVPVERLINFRTAGTTGHTLLLPSHPLVAACYLSFHKRALRHFGIELQHGCGKVGVVLAGYQRSCFTYTSVTPTMNESGLAKINLHPADWRDPDDRARYLDALDPEIYSGDPLSFPVLASLPLRTGPRALLSTSMTLLPGLKQQLEERFSCPVLDIYSMNEAGPIAVFVPDSDGHLLLQHRLYVEILDREGRVLPPGERGEIVISGGFNFCLPLLRYRTGDHASLRFHGRQPVLVELEGRPPVLFRTMSGVMINNIEITNLLRRFAIPQFTVHQCHDGRLGMRLRGAALETEQIRSALLGLFGSGQELDILPLEGPGDKRVQYTSDIIGTLS